MKIIKLLITLFIISILLTNCVSMFPGSRFYEPEDWEEQYFQNSVKNVMPSDIMQDSTKYLGQLLHWVGIADSFDINQNDSILISTIFFEQKYCDYIEDFSIQDERIFLSSFGEGKFGMVKEFNDVPLDTLKKINTKIVNDQSLGFCYGKLSTVINNIPILTDSKIRFIPHYFYSTKIFYYEGERDSNGVLLISEEGVPKLTNFKVLNMAKSGQNK